MPAARFRAEGITGRRRNHKLFGKSDFVFAKLKLAVFVDGRLHLKLCKPAGAAHLGTRTDTEE